MLSAPISTGAMSTQMGVIVHMITSGMNACALVVLSRRGPFEVVPFLSDEQGLSR